MEIRIALALCVVLCGALCGRALAEGAQRRVETLCALVEATRRLRVQMTSLLQPVQLALERSGTPLYSLVAEAMTGGGSAATAWEQVRRRAARRGGAIDSLTDADRKALGDLFAGLGQSGREEQDLLLSGAIEALERLCEAARAKQREADRLYGTLGLLIGLMLALIVI